MALMLLDEFLHLAVSTISIICLSMMRYGKHWKGGEGMRRVSGRGDMMAVLAWASTVFTKTLSLQERGLEWSM